MTDGASCPCSYLCLESHDGSVSLKDKGSAVINGRGLEVQDRLIVSETECHRDMQRWKDEQPKRP